MEKFEIQIKGEPGPPQVIVADWLWAFATDR